MYSLLSAAFGAVLSLFLIPMVESRKVKYLRSTKVNAIYIELEDLKSELLLDVESHFRFLLNIRVAANDDGSVVALPVPKAKRYDSSIIVDLYKDVLTVLSVDERKVIRGIPLELSDLHGFSLGIQKDYLERMEYSIPEIKNLIKLGSLLAHKINGICNQKYRYLMSSSGNSNQAYVDVLKSLNFTDEQIMVSRLAETKIPPDFVN